LSPPDPIETKYNEHYSEVSYLCRTFARSRDRTAYWCGLFASMKQIARSKPNSLAAAIHLDQYQSLWAETNVVYSPVDIPRMNVSVAG
jgi:hypothetical protein